MADQITDLWDDAVWRTAQEDGTEDAYRGYLKRFSRGRHAEEAKSGIEQAFWRECRDSGTRKPCVRYLKEYPSGTHADEAGKVLEDLEYRAVLARGTVEALEAYVKAHPERKEAFKKLRELRFARAESTGALEDWEAYYQKGRFSGWLYRRGFEGMDETANAEIERLLAERIGGDPSLDLYRDYVGRYPSGAHLDEVAEAMEPLLFDQAMSSDKPEPCLEYLERYPQDQRRNEIQDHLDPILFRKAQDEDTVAAYGEYLTKCKVCASSSKALERQAWLRDNPAGARISCPAEVEGNGSWKWETVFTETSGKTGYRVSGSGCVNDPRGGSGQWTERGTVVVKAGGKDSREYSCSSGDHELCNGYALFTWSGEDAGGHLVTLEERVKLIHTGCPGPKK
jgi:hypothetical protein